MSKRWRSAWLKVLVALGLVIVACGYDPVDLTGRDCPCVAGYVCNAETNRCMRTDEITPTGLDATTGEDGNGPTGDGGPSCVGEGCPCTRDPDCADPAFSKCVGNKCVECTQPDNCPTGKYCLSTNQCAPGCKVNGDCSTQDAGATLCNTTRHECVECLAPADCPPGKLCSPSGKCVDGCDPQQGKNCSAGACCSNLCINTTNDLFNCGACGAPCTGANTACCASSCVDPLTNKDNCGGCGIACSTLNGTPGCTAGSCKWTCNPGYSHCGVGNTGCDTNTGSDPTHCGSCTTVCANVVQNATGIGCANSACTYGSCNSGWGNCDSNAGNGCETNLTNDLNHCGNCATNCATQVLHATGISCSSSACNYAACAAGYGDCDGNRANGCECACGGSEQPCCPPNNTCVPGKACELQTHLCK